MAILNRTKTKGRQAAVYYDPQIVGLPRVLLIAPNQGLANDACCPAGLIHSRLSGENWPVAVCPTEDGEFLRSLIRAVPEADVVHLIVFSFFQLITTALSAIVVSRLFGKRVILQIQSVAVVDGIVKWRRVLLPFLRQIDKAILPSVHLRNIIAPLELPTEVVPNLIDPDQYSGRHLQQLQPRILVADPLEIESNLDHAVRAFIDVKQKYPRAELVLAGQGSLRQRLEKAIAEAGLFGIEFIDSVSPEHVRACFNEADLYVSASAECDYPRYLFEAFACGMPVIAAAGPATSEIITDGFNGLLFDPGDEINLANRILELVEDDEKVATLSRQSRATAEQYDIGYHLNDIKRRYVNLVRRSKYA